jgi:ABC-type multidrug transport system fused ATPase/permease subunit
MVSFKPFFSYCIRIFLAIGVISQEPVLFATTIEENIRYGKPEATDEEVYYTTKII